MGLIDYDIEVGKWYEADDGDVVWYDYIISEKNNIVKYIAFNYEGYDVYMSEISFQEFKDEIIDSYIFEEKSRAYVLNEINKEVLFDGIF